MLAISLYCNSEAIMSRAYSNIYNGKSRHISIWHEYIQELITNGVIIIVNMKSMNNLANLLIKGQFRDMVRKKPSRIGLKPVIKDTDSKNSTLN